MTAAELRQRLSDVVRAPTTWGRIEKTATEPQDEVLGAVFGVANGIAYIKFKM